eukprot:jgi/Botrbrau1/14963/Bobra.0018s0066.1
MQGLADAPITFQHITCQVLNTGMLIQNELHIRVGFPYTGDFGVESVDSNVLRLPFVKYNCRPFQSCSYCSLVICLRHSACCQKLVKGDLSQSFILS